MIKTDLYSRTFYGLGIVGFKMGHKKYYNRVQRVVDDKGGEREKMIWRHCQLVSWFPNEFTKEHKVFTITGDPHERPESMDVDIVTGEIVG